MARFGYAVTRPNPCHLIPAEVYQWSSPSTGSWITTISLASTFSTILPLSTSTASSMIPAATRASVLRIPIFPSLFLSCPRLPVDGFARPRRGLDGPTYCPTHRFSPLSCFGDLLLELGFDYAFGSLSQLVLETPFSPKHREKWRIPPEG